MGSPDGGACPEIRNVRVRREACSNPSRNLMERPTAPTASGSGKGAIQWKPAKCVSAHANDRLHQISSHVTALTPLVTRKGELNHWIGTGITNGADTNIWVSFQYMCLHIAIPLGKIQLQRTEIKAFAMTLDIIECCLKQPAVHVSHHTYRALYSSSRTTPLSPAETAAEWTPTLAWFAREPLNFF
jgi:hypothetical protein